VSPLGGDAGDEGYGVGSQDKGFSTSQCEALVSIQDMWACGALVHDS
jgi:hypothetical protein